MSARDDQRLFLCDEHHFVAVAWKNGEVSTRGTPGHRVPGCSTCDDVVSDAIEYAGTAK